MSTTVMGNNPFVNGKLPSSINMSMWGKTHYMKNRDNKRPTVLQRNLQTLIDLRKTDAKNVSKDARVGETYVSDILGGRVLDPGSIKLSKIAAVLGASLADLHNPDYNPETVASPTLIKSDDVKPQNLSDIERGLFALSFGFISHYIQVNPGYRDSLLRIFREQIKFFRVNEQPNVAEVLSRLVENVASDIHTKETLEAHKSLQPSQDQFPASKD